MNTAYNFLRSYVPIRNALKTRLDREFMIASSHEHEIYYLNWTAREIWSKFDGKTNIESLCAEFMNEYNVKQEIIEKDIVSFIRDLQWKKLIRLKTGGID